MIMRELFEQLLLLVLKHNASDVHMRLYDEQLQISLRCANGIVDVKKVFDATLFHYLKFIANLDLGNIGIPQSGNFSYVLKGNEYYFRFAFIQTLDVQSAVLRILNNHQKILLSQLSKEQKQNEIFKKWTKFRGGLSIISGPTGSGKTTTLHALLESIAQNKRLKVITLEDPIEIRSNHYLQLQINERMHFDYEEGIKQLLRHDPDVIMLGEIRDQASARSLIRCALSGHMVFT
ncbi:MAG: competence protein ComG, partial [Erysipelotrichia bacterium]|nr:competence protein ComG [Erysipelotrichia bacterium]